MRTIRMAAICGALGLGGVASVAHELTFEAKLSGAEFDPPTGSSATGNAHITLDLDLVSIHMEIEFAGLSGPTTGAHLHGLTELPFEGVAGIAVTSPSLPEFPIGVLAGDYHHEMSLGFASSYSPGFIAASGGTVGEALNALIFGMQDGQVYVSIKTQAHPNGEIRGFLVEHHHHTPGDMNCDEAVTVSDIAPFVLALTDPAGYAQQFPKCSIESGDLNEDGAVSVGDIGAFVALLTS